MMKLIRFGCGCKQEESTKARKVIYYLLIILSLIFNSS